MTKEEEIIELKKKLEETQSIIKKAMETAKRFEESAEENVKIKAIAIVELRYKDKGDIDRQKLVEKYIYEKGQQDAYEYMKHFLNRTTF